MYMYTSFKNTPTFDHVTVLNPCYVKAQTLIVL